MIPSQPETEPAIRESRPDDLAAIESLYPEAFPNEDLLPLVRELLSEPSGVTSLAAVIAGQIAGHVILSGCCLPAGDRCAALLGPLVVAPDCQRRGIGSALVLAALDRARANGSGRVLVLGDPAYYGRFGFGPERTIEPPFGLPDDLPAEWVGAWQSIALHGEVPTGPARLLVPAPWRKRSLWLP